MAAGGRASQTDGTKRDRRCARYLFDGAVVAALAAYGWWATGLAQFTWPARLAFGLPGAAVVGAAFLNHPRRLTLREGGHLIPSSLSGEARGPTPRTFGTGVWICLIGFAVAWELYSFLSAEHSRLPTISHYLFDVTTHRGAEAGAFVVWMGVGWFLARR
ncbi:MAG: hypothetical protein ACRD1G_20550 [Acidimicrobiales bacterium]